MTPSTWLLSLIAADPLASILAWVVGAAALALVLADKTKAGPTGIAVLSALWLAVVPVIVVARLFGLLIVEGDAKPEKRPSE